MFFKANRVRFRKPDQFEQQAKKLPVVGRFPLGALEHLADVLDRMLDRRKIVRDQEGPDRRAADHDDLERQRLQDWPHAATVDNIAPENHDQNDDDPDYAEHLPRPIP